MKKNIAIITGASGGLGKEFVRELLKEDLDEIWAVARNEKKLEAMKSELEDRKQENAEITGTTETTGSTVTVIRLITKDLVKTEEIEDLVSMVKAEDVTVKWLINNAGMARMGRSDEFKPEEIEQTILLNCNTVAVLSTLCIPHMEKNSHILNISSQSSFQPVPYLNLYASTKVFERNFSRAMNVELKEMGITVTAVCPGWVDTELLLTECNGHKTEFPGIVSAEKVAKKAVTDAKKGKDMSVCTMFVKFMHLQAKVFPQKDVMKTWMKSIHQYI